MTAGNSVGHPVVNSVVTAAVKPFSVPPAPRAAFAAAEAGTAERVLLSITLPLFSEAHSHEQHRMLFHSPLGVYIASTTVARHALHVAFDIDAADLDFTLHTLIGTLPEALIGPVTRRRGTPRTH